ncbi:MAG: CpsB/CapC family capsule biosynthesis tyrosine phosphatase [Nitrospirota bacterium]
MIDLHCHILPGIDDGPAEIGQSIAMARIAAADGITAIVATPHVTEEVYPAEIITQKVQELNRELSRLGIPVAVLQGADVNALLDPDLLRGYTINGSDYLLLEFPYTHLPINTRDILFAMSIKGYIPVITHPERNPSVINNPETLLQLVESTVLVQITAGSLAGEFGQDIRDCAVHLLKRGAVSFIATDAHSTEWRPPVLSKGLRVAEEIVGKERAMRLVTAHPEAVLAGKLLHAA